MWAADRTASAPVDGVTPAMAARKADMHTIASGELNVSRIAGAGARVQAIKDDAVNGR